MAGRPDLLVGAGTVLTPEQVDRAVEAGARFVVTPGFSAAVVRRCQELGVPVFPGVATATEIQMALDAGLDTVKFFPAEQLGGAAMVKALAAPFRGGAVHPHRRGHHRQPRRTTWPLPAVLAVGGTWMVAARPARRRATGPRSPPHRRGRRGRPTQPTEAGGRPMLIDPSGRGVPLRPGLARRGDAAPRSGRGPGPHRPQFRAWEGGGEYNVARGLRRCFGLRTAVVTAFADNEVGRLLEDLILQGGVDTSLIKLGARTTASAAPSATASTSPSAASACAARSASPTAATPPPASCAPGDVDWDHLFGTLGRALAAHRRHLRRAVRDHARTSIEAAMAAARRHGTVISYDLNYRPSLWKAIGGKARAQEVNRRLARYVDVMIGNEEDFTACLGFEVPGHRRRPVRRWRRRTSRR